jgi:nitroreductase
MEAAKKGEPMDFFETVRKRRSVCHFSDQPVPHKDILAMLEAAILAPSATNEQPWRFIVCTRDRPADHQRFVGCLVEGNVPWAQHAPVLVLSVAKRQFSHNGTPNRHAWHDVGLAVENLILQATALGLFVHQMGGFDPAKARTAFGIPDEYEPVAAIAIGYPGEADTLPPPLRDRQLAPRSRKPLEALVFKGGWGQAASVAGRQS